MSNINGRKLEWSSAFGEIGVVRVDASSARFQNHSMGWYMNEQILMQAFEGRCGVNKGFTRKSVDSDTKASTSGQAPGQISSNKPSKTIILKVSNP